MSRRIAMRQALNEAMCEEMERSPQVFLIGEEVGRYDGAYKVSQGMLERFGAERVVDTPISENGFTGLAIGAAMTGLRPIVEFMSFNFSLVAFDQIISNAAKTRYMSGGQFAVPMVMRGPGGAAAQVAAQHSNVLDSLFAFFPGLRVLSPSTPADAKGLLKTAIRDDNPVIFVENEMLYGIEGEVPEGDHLVPMGSARLERLVVPGESSSAAGDGPTRALREGSRRTGDRPTVTIIAHSRMAAMVRHAAADFVNAGIEAELLDLRSIKPLDERSLFQAVRRTHRAVIVEEGHRFCGVGAEIAERIYSACFDDLDAPIARVTQSENPLPYARNLEAASLPNPQQVLQAARRVLYWD